MNRKPKAQKGFIQIPILFAVIFAIAVISGAFGAHQYYQKGTAQVFQAVIQEKQQKEQNLSQESIATPSVATSQQAQESEAKLKEETTKAATVRAEAERAKTRETEQAKIKADADAEAKQELENQTRVQALVEEQRKIKEQEDLARQQADLLKQQQAQKLLEQQQQEAQKAQEQEATLRASKEVGLKAALEAARQRYLNAMNPTPEEQQLTSQINDLYAQIDAITVQARQEVSNMGSQAVPAWAQIGQANAVNQKATLTQQALLDQIAGKQRQLELDVNQRNSIIAQAKMAVMFAQDDLNRFYNGY